MKKIGNKMFWWMHSNKGIWCRSIESNKR